MTAIRDYFLASQERIPRWLASWGPRSRFPSSEFFRSRCVYYPGSGCDGQPLKLFGASHSVHSFIYADYGLTGEQVDTQLADPSEGVAGYVPSFRVSVDGHRVFPGWINPHFDRARVRCDRILEASNVECGFLQVLDREPHLADDHGPARLAILFLFTDGITAYDALFCQRPNQPPPFGVLLHDHGFGGNYDRFGRGGLLHQIVEQSRVMPEYLLVASHTVPWPGYSRCPGLVSDPGGMNGTGRSLWQRDREP